MGREVRRVSPDWQHPRDAAGRLRPLRAADFSAAVNAWDAGFAKWDRGLIASHCSIPGVPTWRPRDEFTRAGSYEEHAGPRPRASDYMPAWPEAERTAWQLYETVTAGTPISPPCTSPESLALWLCSHDASAGPGMTATLQEWLVMIRGAGRSALFVMERGQPESALKIPRAPAYVRFFRWFRRGPAYD